MPLCLQSRQQQLLLLWVARQGLLNRCCLLQHCCLLLLLLVLQSCGLLLLLLLPLLLLLVVQCCHLLDAAHRLLQLRAQRRGPRQPLLPLHQQLLQLHAHLACHRVQHRLQLLRASLLQHRHGTEVVLLDCHVGCSSQLRLLLCNPLRLRLLLCNPLRLRLLLCNPLRLLLLLSGQMLCGTRLCRHLQLPQLLRELRLLLLLLCLLRLRLCLLRLQLLCRKLHQLLLPLLLCSRV